MRFLLCHHFLISRCVSTLLHLVMFSTQISFIGIFSGNLSLDLSEGSKWNISRSGFCGMRSKKVNNRELSFFLQNILIQNIFSACQSLFEEKKKNGLLYLRPGFVNETFCVSLLLQLILPSSAFAV